MKVAMNSLSRWEANYHLGSVDAVRKSIEAYGFNGALCVRGGIIYAGNTSFTALELIRDTSGQVPYGIEVVQGEWQVEVIPLDHLSHEQAVAFAIAHNRTSELGGQDDELLAELLSGLGSGEAVFDLYQPDEIQSFADLLDRADSSPEDTLERGEPVDDAPPVKNEPKQADFSFRDYVYPSNNQWGVPLLALESCAEALIAPAAKWGTVARSTLFQGTYHFYTDDYKFEGLWKDPRKLLKSGVRCVIEPNFSTNEQYPQALALADIYRKRFLSRFWAEAGVKIICDLNLPPSMVDIAILGIPDKWSLFAVRSLESREDNEAFILFWAQQARAFNASATLVVVGGRKKTALFCQYNGFVHIPEDVAIATGEKI